MRRVVCHAFGPLTELVVEEGPDLVAGDGQVVIDVTAAGASLVDGLIVQGRYQIKPALPFTPGMEVAGTVAGTGRTGLRAVVGGRVRVAGRGAGHRRLPDPRRSCPTGRRRR